MFSRNKHSVSKIQFKLLCEKVAQIRATHDCLVLYGSPTEGNWLGIANATKGLFQHNCLEIPQWYSQPKLNGKQTQALCTSIKEYKFSTVIISGFAAYFFEWIDVLYTDINVRTLFHGTISEFHNEGTRRIIGKIVDYNAQQKLENLLFVKKGLAEVFERLYGFNNCQHQPLATPKIPPTIPKLILDRNKIHIGVFGADTFNKNLHNQVIHALMIENVVVHVLDRSIFSYLNVGNRIIEHGKNLSREKFLSVLGSMDINLYMSFNESWGLVAFESEALGVPCVRLDDINYLDKIDKILKRKYA